MTHIVIPVHNEESVIGELIRAIKAEGFSSIIVVDDGSSDRSSTVAKNAGAVVVRHTINRGKGAATRTGIEAAKKLGATQVITLDGDGQHDALDVKKISDALVHTDVVLGVRSDLWNKMPKHKVIANMFGNILTYFIYGLWVNDSQSGFRGYSVKALSAIITQFDGYEYESEVIGQIKKHNLTFSEIPITTRYTNYSQNKKQRQKISNGLKMIYRMFFYN